MIEPIAAPAAAPAATPPAFHAADSPYADFSALLSDFIALYVSIPALIRVAPPAIAPAPAAIPVAAKAPAPIEAPPARFPAPKSMASIADFPSNPEPVAAEPMSVPANEVPAVPFPNIALPSPAAPLPMPTSGVAIFIRSAADNTDDKSADSPPGSSLDALLTTEPKPSHSLLATVSKSKPSENPFANEAPRVFPSSMVSEMSMPKMVATPTVKPVPIALPISPAITFIFAFPLELHHSENGCTMYSSQRILPLPKKSAFCHSSVAEMSLNFLFMLSSLRSAESIASLNNCSAFGTCAVSHCTISRSQEFDIRSPSEIFRPSTADWNNVMSPERLSIMVSDIRFEAPSAFEIASASLL